MKKRILTGITTTGTPHIGNYLGAIKPALKLAGPDTESYFFLADYHALIKQTDPSLIETSVKDIALAFANVLVLNDVSVPLGDLPVVFLNLPATLVSGNSKVAIEVLSNSYL